MLTFLYYALMLLVGFVFTGTAKAAPPRVSGLQRRAPQAWWACGFLVLGAVGCYLLFALLRGWRGRGALRGKGLCGADLHAGGTGRPVLGQRVFLLWCVLAFGYALYVTLRIWLRP